MLSWESSNCRYWAQKQQRFADKAVLGLYWPMSDPLLKCLPFGFPMCWGSARPTLPRAAALSPCYAAVSGNGAELPSPLLPPTWWQQLRCLCRNGTLAPTQPSSAVQRRSTTGFNLLPHAPPPALLPLLFGGSPGSDLTVTTTFISCSLGKWWKGNVSCTLCI